jgi:beta-glucosidase
MIFLYHSYLLGVWPPQEKSLLKTIRAQGNLLRAHIKSYRLIKDIYKKHNLSNPMVSIAQNMQAFVPCSPTLRNKLAVNLRARVFNLEFIRRSIAAKTLDFIGVNYYSRSLVELKGWGIKNFALDLCDGKHSNLRRNSLGWEIYPGGLYEVLASLKKYRLPVFILENGICTDDDSLRWDYISEHLMSLNRAISSGINVLGYVYWSLMDNYEWDKGFGPRFGLIDIDYSTFKRTVRDSGRKFAQVCLEGKL